MGKRKDLSEFDRGQIVMARRLGQSISKTEALVGCSWSAVVSIYQKWTKEGTVVNWRQGHGWPRLIDARGERRLARVVRSNRRATVAQIAQEVNAGSDRKIPQHTFRGLVESMPRRLFWQQKGDQHNIRKVVIMLCLIGVCVSIPVHLIGSSSAGGYSPGRMLPSLFMGNQFWKHIFHA
ncbi:hypothetical protein DPX16_20747 [Anabarilius grahami]|uniref:Transposase Tc1-like domain-containing protein n=1 Tax=Anabarilius grahami TaxID=495550 RepID=A0A3N0YFC4_ANAGA|nr:hypothetical protein DPX16_20747 [Anabarilius grahami]